MPIPKSPESEVKDQNARKASQSAISIAREALRISKANAELIKMFEKKLDQHSVNSAAASEAVMNEVVQNRDLFTTKFKELSDTVSKLNLRASVEDQKTAVDLKVENELEKRALRKKLIRSKWFSTIAWIAAVCGGVAGLGAWLDPHPFHFDFTVTEDRQNGRQ